MIFHKKKKESVTNTTKLDTMQLVGALQCAKAPSNHAAPVEQESANFRQNENTLQTRF